MEREIRRVLIVALSFGVAGNALALERLMRRYDWRAGYPIQTVVNLEQDDRKFLWIAANGLFRFDGRDMRRWSNDRCGLIHGSARIGRTSVIDDVRRSLWRVSTTGLEPATTADGRPLGPVAAAAYSDDGSLWYVPLGAPRDVWRLDPFGARGSAPRWSADEDVFTLRRGGGSTIVAITPRSASRLGPEGLLRTWDVPNIRDVLVRADGSLVMAINIWTGPSHLGTVAEEKNGTLHTLFSHSSRIIGLAERGDAIWAAYDFGLARIAPNDAVVLIGKADGLESGGPLLVDHEGSVWVGTFRGLVQYPEPDTVAWGDAIDDVGRWVARTSAGETWMVGWSHVHRVTGAPGAWSTRTDRLVGALPCAVIRGQLWSAWGEPFDLKTEPLEAAARRAAPVSCGPCGQGPSGLWFAGPNKLLLLRPGEERPRRPRSQPPPRPGSPAALEATLEDGAGRLWISRGNTICHADARAVASDAETSWTCETAEGVRGFDVLAATPSGDLWAVVDSKRLLRRAGGRWEPIPGAAEGGDRLVAVVPSPSGGFWIAGENTMIRVLERPDSSAGWEVVESLGAWQGVSTLSSGWIVEEASGALWLADAAALTYVPPQARRARPGPLDVGVAEITADGRLVDPSGEIELPYGHNNLEVRVAVPSFRDPGRLRHRVRMNPDDPWSEPSEAGVFRYQHVPSGMYRVEVSASLDGTSWAVAGVPIVVRVARPWYLRWEALVLFVGVALAILFFVFRVRLAQVVRLERQRARIAMDLHDELGSGLGSIGILSELSARPHVQETRRRDMAAEINRVAATLADALSDLVGSLRPGAATLDSLAHQVSERAHALFPGGTAAIVDRLPRPVPTVSLSLPVRRNVLLVAAEALHNAARHSGASRVEIGLAPEGRRWRLWVADDGRGFGLVGRTITATHGLGLASMRRRADDIGADFSISPAAPDGTGTKVSLVFDPMAEDRRLAGESRPVPRGWRG